MADYKDSDPQEFAEIVDFERKPFAGPSLVAPDRTGQLWWRGPADLNANTHTCILFKVIGPPRLLTKTIRDQNILGEWVFDEEYDYSHPIEQIIPYADNRYSREWREGYHSWESESHSDQYMRVAQGSMQIKEEWRHRVGQMWRRSDYKEKSIFSKTPADQWGNFVIVSTKVHENTCTVVHDVVYVDSHRSTIVEHSGATAEKEWCMDTDPRFERIS